VENKHKQVENPNGQWHLESKEKFNFTMRCKAYPEYLIGGDVKVGDWISFDCDGLERIFPTLGDMINDNALEDSHEKM
jgi:hypothetical protein